MVASATATAIKQVLKTKYIVAARDERLGDAGHIVRERAGHAAERFVGKAGGLHRDGQARHAEQRPVERVLRLHPERALAPRARDRHQHRFVRPEQQQRREVDGVRHRHRRSALGERQAHLERGRDGRRDQQNREEQWDCRTWSEAPETRRGGRQPRWRRRRKSGQEAARRACALVSYEPRTALARVAMTAIGQSEPRQVLTGRRGARVRLKRQEHT